ncbi:uncharacterized protein LOC122263380 [Penaeus japonicus]|uniref:uncharacterized protein LOC122263380 n=1 Tax=Penaeus japonicus TaxID=27405 RepID=UPI001C70B90A|nr:uncharacterized protein LOC122263380 [Penaeus japonicus]
MASTSALAGISLAAAAAGKARVLLRRWALALRHAAAMLLQQAGRALAPRRCWRGAAAAQPCHAALAPLPRAASRARWRAVLAPGAMGRQKAGSTRRHAMPAQARWRARAPCAVLALARRASAGAAAEMRRAAASVAATQGALAPKRALALACCAGVMGRLRGAHMQAGARRRVLAGRLARALRWRARCWAGRPGRQAQASRRTYRQVKAGRPCKQATLRQAGQGRQAMRAGAACRAGRWRGVASRAGHGALALLLRWALARARACYALVSCCRQASAGRRRWRCWRQAVLARPQANMGKQAGYAAQAGAALGAGAVPRWAQAGRPQAGEAGEAGAWRALARRWALALAAGRHALRHAGAGALRYAMLCYALCYAVTGSTRRRRMPR